MGTSNAWQPMEPCGWYGTVVELVVSVDNFSSGYTVQAGCVMDRDPTQLRSEISQLIKKQIDALGKETFGGATDAEHREYLQRQTRIDELYGDLQRLKSAA